MEGDLAAYVEATQPADSISSTDVVSTDVALIQRVEAHLARCPHCAARVESYRRAAAVLHAALYRASCSAPERLALYQLSLLSARERWVVARHVRECPHCQQELIELSREAHEAGLAGSASAGQPPSLLERLRQAVGGIEAALLPAPPALALGLRGAAPAAQTYRVEGLDILVMVQPGHAKGYRTVRGRLLPEQRTDPPEWGPEAWWMEGELAQAAPVDARGTFCFEEVEPGVYSVGLEWRGQAVRIGRIEIE
jgi:uncharacterized protein with PIN domain